MHEFFDPNILCHLIFVHLGAEVLVDVGCAQRPREVLETPGAVDGSESSQLYRPHDFHQRLKEERPLCAGTCKAGFIG